MTMGITSPTSTTGQILKDGTPVISFDANNNATFAGTVVSNTPLGMRNRIINGDMRIDQRNAGASVTPTASAYTLDRWEATVSATSKYSVIQNTNSTAGYNTTGQYYSLLATSLSAYTVGASEAFTLTQYIEGYNVADMMFGTSGAKTFTLSFWVYSSLTGTFGGAFQNSGRTRSYPFTYTISAANTWEQKTITVTGDTTGTWLTTNGRGLNVIFSLGAGSTLSGTAGAWATATYYSATGATSVVGTNGATFYITGVQLEIGTSATPFERRLYNQELANCQRYYIKYGTYSSNSIVAQGSAIGTTTAYVSLTFPVSMRTTPTFNSNTLTIGDGVNAATTVTGAVISTLTSDKYGAIDITVASGLTQYRPYTLRATATTGYTEWSAEL